MANNPTLVAFLEALKAFKVDMSQLEILSLGTGHKNLQMVILEKMGALLLDEKR